MLLDLAKYKCTHFLVEWRIPHDFNLVSLSDVVGQRITPSKPYTCKEAYTISGGFHIVDAQIVRKPRQTCELTLHFDCFLNEEGETSQTDPVTQLIQKLSALELVSTFHYEIVLTFSREASRLFFPLKLPVIAGAILDEFRGFNGVKYESGKLLYKLSIESPELKELYFNVEFHRRESFSSGSLEQKLGEAVNIAKNIIPEDEWRL
jgi:hypothetical protein